MTEADIYQKLADLAGGRVYPYVAPQKTAPPWIVFRMVSAVSDDVFCGPAETATAVQIDAWASSIDEASALREQVRAAILPLRPVGLNELSDYEPETALYRAMLEIQLWH